MLAQDFITNGVSHRFLSGENERYLCKHIWTCLTQQTGKFFLTLPTIRVKFWTRANIWGTNSF